MTRPIDAVEIAAIKACAEFEAKWGGLTSAERLNFKMAFCEGALWAFAKSGQLAEASPS